MFDWKDIIIGPNASIIEAIEQLNQTGRMFLIVVNKQGKLLGNLTDGDLRKGLLKFNSMSVKVELVMNRHTICASEELSHNEVRVLFRSPSIRAIPVINANNTVVGCHFIENFQNFLPNDARLLIMAGGFGSRMGHLTKTTPKPMLKIMGKPILQHIIANARNHGCSRITISLHYHPEVIKGFFGDGSKFGVEISYLQEDTPLGTAGCLQRVHDDTKYVIIMNADIISEVDLSSLLDYHKVTDADATMATHEHVITNPYGVVRTEGISIVGLDEKPKWKSNVNAGVYVINTPVKSFIMDNEKIDMPEFFLRLINNQKKVVIYPLQEKVIEIGTPETYYSHNPKG